MEAPDIDVIGSLNALPPLLQEVLAPIDPVNGFCLALTSPLRSF